MTKKNRKQTAWADIEDALRKDLGPLVAWWADVEDFRELRFKAKDDGTILVIAKGFGSDGTPMVCFGVGYDMVTALMGINATIQGNKWRIDKPWQPSKK